MGLAEDTLYFYRVVAFNTDGASAPSNVAFDFTSFARPNQVSGLTGSFANGVTSLSWTDNADNETRFEVERAEEGVDLSYSVIAVLPANATTHQDSTALDGHRTAIASHPIDLTWPVEPPKPYRLSRDRRSPDQHRSRRAQHRRLVLKSRGKVDSIEPRSCRFSVSIRILDFGSLLEQCPLATDDSQTPASLDEPPTTIACEQLQTPPCQCLSPASGPPVSGVVGIVCQLRC